MKVTSKILDDIVSIYRKELSEFGYDTSMITDNKELLIIYYTISNRLISRCKRCVHFAKEFKCPKELQKGLNLLIDKFEKGENVNPHLSKLSNRTERLNSDKLLYDWNIYHFHLGEIVEEDGFINRTKELLFCMLFPTDVYFIGIMNHGDWSNIDLPQIVHDNWPELLKGFKTYKTNVHFTPSQINELRKYNINGAITLKDGNGYIPMGGGLTTSGHSLTAVREASNDNNSIMQLERSIINNPSDYSNNCPPQLLTKFREDGIELRARYQANNIYIYDYKTNLNISVREHLPLKEKFNNN